MCCATLITYQCPIYHSCSYRLIFVVPLSYSLRSCSPLRYGSDLGSHQTPLQLATRLLLLSVRRTFISLGWDILPVYSVTLCGIVSIKGTQCAKINSRQAPKPGCQTLADYCICIDHCSQLKEKLLKIQCQFVEALIKDSRKWATIYPYHPPISPL